MWKKITPSMNYGPRRKRTKFAVRRNRSGNQSAFLIVPEGAMTSDRVDIYENGNLLAFSESPTGAYGVGKTKQSSSSTISIPAQYSKMLPFGTTDVDVQRDGSMVIIDLSTIGKKLMVAE